MHSLYRMEARKKWNFIPSKEHTPNLTHKGQELNSEGAPFSSCHPSKKIKAVEHAVLYTETLSAAAPNASPARPVTDLHCLVTSCEIKTKKITFSPSSLALNSGTTRAGLPSAGRSQERPPVSAEARRQGWRSGPTGWPHLGLLLHGQSPISSDTAAFRELTTACWQADYKEMEESLQATFCCANCDTSTWNCRGSPYHVVQQCPWTPRSATWGQPLPQQHLPARRQAVLRGAARPTWLSPFAPGPAKLTLTRATGQLVWQQHLPGTSLCPPCCCRAVLAGAQHREVCTEARKRHARCAQPHQKSTASNVGFLCPYIWMVSVKILST